MSGGIRIGKAISRKWRYARPFIHPNLSCYLTISPSSHLECPARPTPQYCGFAVSCVFQLHLQLTSTPKPKASRVTVFEPPCQQVFLSLEDRVQTLLLMLRLCWHFLIGLALAILLDLGVDVETGLDIQRLLGFLIDVISTL